ncbi:enoyl-CoA hydratase/isomerase family protein [Noviherbaspirillum galbum]|uniref:Enoyl-CoA hydratase/isomerase family protein n=1 Tax=Noviherbaspirillum galbum TaxID=2709383 RepID=A0A6B3SKN0_9BURK|nr:enoyl-CoA hydratase/isomerase family protein [Noviherbaspirillum galbum]NEX61317.1 enoyl-CoA hydratase/isomerase family protein [Noviherbaspirillum galbum]
MSAFVKTEIKNRIAHIILDRPKALNSLSLDMVRAITAALLAWRDDAGVQAVVIRSTSERALCAGGDIRFFHDAGTKTPQGGSALLEDFFTEEYSLNHLIHHYPKPYVAIMDGIVMGGGMGVAEGGEANRLRIVTERSKIAMPEVNIGLFPDVGGGYFLSRAPGQIGTYLGVTGETIGAADAIAAGLADVFVPSDRLPAMMELLDGTNASDIRAALREFAAPHREAGAAGKGILAAQRERIDRHFAFDTVADIMASLAGDDDPFAQRTLDIMRKRSPLMMCVTLEQLRRGASMSLAECLRVERTLVRRTFEHGEVLEGVRALVVDKDNAPRWNPGSVEEVTPEMVAGFFDSPWPGHAHPLRGLE